MKIDMIGKRFGKLTVISFDHRDRRGQLYWACKCDCGNKKSVRGGNLRFGTIISCGCYRTELQHSNVGNKHHCWKGYGEIPMGYYLSIKQGATKRKISFDVSIERLWEIFLAQNRKCALSGLPISFQSKQRAFDGTASLDRIDSSRGYVSGNLQWVHKEVNFMKRNLEQAHFIELCQRIYENHSE